jgi:hypothetical protein
LPATFRRRQLDSREDLRKRFRVRDRAHQISSIRCPLFSQHVSRKSVAVVVVVVLIKDSIFDVDAPPPPSSSSVVVLFDHFCAENLMFLKIFVARVVLFLFCALAKVNTRRVTIVYIYTFLLQFHDALCVMRSGDVCCLCDVLQKYERKVSAELSVSSLASRAKSACSSSARSRK